MTAPTDRNRLSEAGSPYLRQHADNPVHWQPWDEKALAAASEGDRPIFLSVGYAACHWCHVMADESFDDETVAEALNEHFVPIKVDREERPDLDTIYQTVCQLVSGRGGWPLSVWLTPDGRPFYVGTYFPKESRRGMPGFLELLEQIATSWESDRQEVENRADQWHRAVTDHLENVDRPEGGRTEATGTKAVADQEDAPFPTQDSPAGHDQLQNAADAAVRSADREHGGFGAGAGPKFPQPARLHLLFRAYHWTGREAYLDVATHALDAMAEGGLYDHVGGGFHRYCVDRDWTVPHFEKMLYDNAELPRAYLAGYQLTGQERYREVVEGTLAFLERELRHDGGGFFSTLDAQSVGESGEREEGAFYVFTPAEIREVLDDETDAELFCEYYGITERGNFEGSNVLGVSASIDDLAETHGLDTETAQERLEAARSVVFEARERRSRPPRDEKVLASWNGLAIKAAAEAAIVLGEDRYAKLAGDALSFVRNHLWAEDELVLCRRYIDGDVAVSGFLDDYAFLARGALALHEATGELDPLDFALNLADTIETEFWDDERGTLYFTPQRGESLTTRPQDLRDQSTPSATGVALEVLQRLAPFGRRRFEEIAETALETHARTVRASPLEYATLALETDRFHQGLLEFTVAAEAVPSTWRARIGETYLPDRLLTRRPVDDGDLETWIDRLDLESPPPIWDGRDPKDGDPTLYVCRSFSCSPPTNDVDEALSWATSFKWE